MTKSCCVEVFLFDHFHTPGSEKRIECILQDQGAGANTTSFINTALIPCKRDFYVIFGVGLE